MAKNILNYAFKSRKTAIGKFINNGHEFGISKNLFYHEKSHMEICSPHKKVLKWSKSSNTNETLVLQKNLVFYIGNRNIRKFITACDLPEEDVYIYSEQSNFQLMSKTKVLYLFVCKTEINWRFPFLKKVDFKNLLRQTFINFNAKNWVCEKLSSKQTENGKGSSNEENKEVWGGPKSHSLITFIKDNFDEVIAKNAYVLIFFSANWCQFCRKLKIPFGLAAVMAKEANLPVVFATFDVAAYPDIADEKGVLGVPVIKYYKNGVFVSDFKGKRTAEALLDFVKNIEVQNK